jgi:hypothetical protein
MKTVYTTLPIYKARRDQFYQRGLLNGSVQFAPVFCPKHRLPSFQWIDDGDGAASVDSIYLCNETETDITSYFVNLPALYTSDAGDDYFQYKGETLNYALPEGKYYLKIIMDTDHVYFSDWFLVQCVYCPFGGVFVNNSYDTFSISKNVISSAIDAGTNAYAISSEEEVYLGQQITIMFYLTTSGATTPSFSVVSGASTISNVATSAAGLNELTLTTTAAADDAVIRIQNAGAANFSTTEILVYTQYACGYVTLSFSNCCNLGDLLYEDDFYQTLWLKSDNIEHTYPYTEKGQENGDGKFIPTFRRQDKLHTLKTGVISQYMVDVLHRLQLHDVMTFIDQVGDAFNVESVTVEHEWLFDDKYYATATINLDLGEAITAFGCC